jgi:hypothetical protein
MDTMKKIALSLVWGAMLVPAFVFSTTVAESEADAACGCLAKFRACTRKVAKGEAKFDECGQALEKCGTACSDKKDCLAECGKAKDEGKAACEEGYDETQCPLGGSESKACEKKAKKLLDDCKGAVRDMKDDCKKLCKAG